MGHGPGGGDSRPVMLSDYIIVIGSKGHDFRKKNRRGGLCGGRASPLLARRGGRDTKKNIAKLPLMERTGWWIKIKRKCFDLSSYLVQAPQIELRPPHNPIVPEVRGSRNTVPESPATPGRRGAPRRIHALLRRRARYLQSRSPACVRDNRSPERGPNSVLTAKFRSNARLLQAFPESLLSRRGVVT